MNISEKGLNIIKKFEGLVLKPYLCPAGVPTIGYGSTVYPNGRAVTLKDKAITENEAHQILLATVKKYEDAVNRYVSVSLTQNQFDALVDFAYNVGIGNLQKSTLLKRVNAGDFAGAKREFSKWIYGAGKPLKGLINRRAAEEQLFAA